MCPVASRASFRCHCWTFPSSNPRRKGNWCRASRASLLRLPLSHVYGLTVSVMALHATEPGTSVLMRWFDPAGWLSLAAERRVEISALVPSMIQMLLTQPLEDYDLSALRRVASGGAPL